MTREGRRYPRVGSVVLKARVRSGEERFDAYVTSVSEGGAFLLTQRELGIGRRVDIELRLPFGIGAVQLEAETLYLDRLTASAGEPLPGYGIGFIGTDTNGGTAARKVRAYVDGFRTLAASLGESGDEDVLVSRSRLGPASEGTGDV